MDSLLLEVAPQQGRAPESANGLQQPGSIERLAEIHSRPALVRLQLVTLAIALANQANRRAAQALAQHLQQIETRHVRKLNADQP